MAKTVLLDFDGVLHSYRSGWQGPRCIPDPPVPGMLEWLERFLWDYCTPPDGICAMAPDMPFEVMIFSSRSRHWGGRRAMKAWMVEHGLNRAWFAGTPGDGGIKFPLKKPPAFVTIDDRAICFNGTPEGLTEQIHNFKPWMKKEQSRDCKRSTSHTAESEAWGGGDAGGPRVRALDARRAAPWRARHGSGEKDRRGRGGLSHAYRSS